jgi:prolipoprotein diacylglyceryltransferase
MNGEVYGSVTDAAWAMEFPYAVRCRHTVTLYDGVKNLLLVPILLGIRIISLRCNGYLPGKLILGYFVLWYSLLRLFVDYFRKYDSYWLASAGASTSICSWPWWGSVSSWLCVRTRARTGPRRDGKPE